MIRADGRVVAGAAGLPDHLDRVDLVVVGLGITGAGVALDAATWGLRVVALDAHDLAFGTSRWSSKLVHGGLRYLAQGQVAVACESAVERGRLMTTIAPHLTRALPMLVPLTPSVSRAGEVTTMAGLRAGDALRVSARTSARLLPRPRRISTTEARWLAPGLRRTGLRGGLVSWDGQLEDDARLVVAVARTAAAYGALVRTRVRVLEATGEGVRIRDELTGEVRDLAARAVVNAAGVWAGGLAGDVRLRPSRGTHLVLPEAALPDLRVELTVPVPGERNRYVFALPQPDGTRYLGITDEPVEGPIPDVPEPSEAEVDFLLSAISTALERPLARADVVGAFAGLRPLLDTGDGVTADLSRRHAVLTAPDGLITVVGGKLTTYRRMAQDAVDAALTQAGLAAGPCRTRRLPLLGAAARDDLALMSAPRRLVRRYGTEADSVLDSARAATGLPDDELLAPVAPGIPTCLAELVFGVTHEGAVTVDDLLDRRTRVGLIAADRAAAEPAALRALEVAAAATG
ncbi:MAG: glycerol-3-phosphate dehydrogenase/oxidase [Nocardioides sp.]